MPQRNGELDDSAQVWRGLLAMSRLHAAAPDLLAALQRMTDYMTETVVETDGDVRREMRDEHPAEWRLIDAARAALAKAKGE